MTVVMFYKLDQPDTTATATTKYIILMCKLEAGPGRRSDGEGSATWERGGDAGRRATAGKGPCQPSAGSVGPAETRPCKCKTPQHADKSLGPAALSSKHQAT